MPTPLSSDIENIPSGAESPMEEVPSPEDVRRQEHLVDVHGNLGFASDEEGLKSVEGSRADLTALDTPGTEEGRGDSPESTPRGKEPEQNEGTELQEKSSEPAPSEHGPVPKEDPPAVSSDEEEGEKSPSSRVNQRGVRFTVEMEEGEEEGSLTSLGKGELRGEEEGANIPYGLPCVRELFRFLISLTNPLDQQNTEQMVQMGLNLLTVALEAGADYLGPYTLLMPLVKNELCRALFLLLQTDKLTVFASALRVCFLLFEALRTHLKFQLEMYLSRMMELVVRESGRISFEQKEMALEALVQLWRIPGLVTELYLNYDCDLYCSNLFEDLTKLLSKNAFPVTGLYSTHILSLDALLTVVDTIEANCHYRMMTHKHQRGSSVGSTGPEPEEDHHNITQTEAGQVPSPTHQLPAASGFAMGRKLSEMFPTTESLQTETEGGERHPAVHAHPPPTHHPHREEDRGVEEALQLPQVRPNRMPISAEIPSHEDLIAQKKKKKLLTQGTESFNLKPASGIAFLQEHGLLQTPLNPAEAVEWLKENPRLEKKKIADYIVNRKNSPILEAFVKSFDFDAVRLDDALRMFLESFRLPGEAAEISMVIEHFADHWHTANAEPFANTDAAFTLAYAVIMLNVDQHSPTVKRNQQPMTVEDFKRNLSGVNGKKNFDPELLEEIYLAIRSEEIVMPAEQTGLIKENYMWKVLLRRGTTRDGVFVHVPSGLYDHDLFGLVWGPTIAALSFVFDKSEEDSILQKAMSGFRKCSAIAAHYGMSDVFDNLIISLCKFSCLASGESPDHLAIAFGENTKAHMAGKAMFLLVHNHGDILREGWKNILDCLLQLYRAALLPPSLTEAEDFVDQKGWVSIVREKSEKATQQKTESGLFNSLVLYLGGSSGDAREAKGPTPDEQEYIKVAHSVIAECHPEHLVTDSKYLTEEALSELFKALVISSAAVSTGAQGEKVTSESVESAVVFYLELMVSIALENRDRLGHYWKTLRGHMYTLLYDSKKTSFLVERAVVGLLRLAVRLLFRDDISDEVLQSLGLLQLLRPSTLNRLAQQIACGLHELLRTNAANIHKRQHWSILFSLLEAAGAAAYPDSLTARAAHRGQAMGHSDSMHSLDDRKSKQRKGSQSDADDEDEMEVDESSLDRGYTSDSELYEARRTSVGGLGQTHSGSGEWMVVQQTEGSTVVAKELNLKKALAGSANFNKYSIVLRPGLRRHDPKAFIKCCETLAFLVRDAAHITPENFDSCVGCLRTFAEASLDGGRYALIPKQKPDDSTLSPKGREKKFGLRKKDGGRGKEMSPGGKRGKSQTPPSLQGEEEGQPEEGAITDSYHQLSHQLIDLTHTLHVKASGIFKSWAENDKSVDASSTALWHQCWRPLLQCIARLCCDCRRQIRTYALNYLQRAFLVHDLQHLSSEEWEDCFAKVLFPLLGKLLDNISPMDPLGMEETRVRATTLLCKIFLQHLSPLSGLPTFNALWMTILEFMERYLHTDRSDLLSEAIPESLKNMLLVMETAGMFQSMPHLYTLTTDRLATFLPALMGEVLPNAPVHTSQSVTAQVPRHQVHAGSIQQQPTGQHQEHHPVPPGPHQDSPAHQEGRTYNAPPPTLPPPEDDLMGVIVHKHADIPLASPPSPPPNVPTPPTLASQAPPTGLPFGQSVILAPPTPLVSAGGLLGGAGQPVSSSLVAPVPGSHVILHPPMAALSVPQGGNVPQNEEGENRQ